jgi:dTDP-4-dehydrorhamnose 3,5-epimerase-like enzyme
MRDEIRNIAGGKSSDPRGTVSFVNHFDMSPVKRFYIIENSDTEIIRGWRGHRIEQRWFTAIVGNFVIKFVKVDDWNAPSPELEVKVFTLSCDLPAVLHVPHGYASAFQALDPGSRLLVFSDYPIDQASEDDYLFPVSFFNFRKGAEC